MLMLLGNGVKRAYPSALYWVVGESRALTGIEDKDAPDAHSLA
jgi:hypothetical protein